jgi:hypothetical protein
MLIEVITMFLAPVLYCAVRERRARRQAARGGAEAT